MRRSAATLLVCLLAAGCASRYHSLPASPTGRTEPGPILAPLVPAELPAPEAVPPLEAAREAFPVRAVPVVTPTDAEWQQFQHAKAPKEPEPPVEPPAKTISRANALATLSPSRQGYANDASVVQHYPYTPGTRYEIYTSPNAPTTILLPVGERLASPPMLNPDAWDVHILEAGEGPERQEAIILRPVSVGLDATIPLFTKSGLRFFCRVRSFEKTSMVAVSWMVPKRRPVLVAETPKDGPPHYRPVFQPPMIDRTRLFHGYSLDYDADHRPPWVPTGVFDDGKQTVIQFAEPLDFTNAPVLAALHSDGVSGLIQYSPYSVPNHPEKGFFYVAVGLWPRLELKGTDGYVVRIVRQSPPRR